MPEKLREFLDSLTQAEAELVYDWIDNEPHAELIVQAFIAQKFPKIFEVPPEFWALMNPEGKA